MASCGLSARMSEAAWRESWTRGKRVEWDSDKEKPTFALSAPGYYFRQCRGRSVASVASSQSQSAAVHRDETRHHLVVAHSTTAVASRTVTLDLTACLENTTKDARCVLFTHRCQPTRRLAHMCHATCQDNHTPKAPCSPQVIGLTGGIASGKSTVSRLLTSHRIRIIDADILARDVVAPGTSGFKLLVAHFGPDRILRADGTLDRAALGDIVFNDPEQRAWLNGVIHPRVRRAMLWQVAQAWWSGEWAVVLDVPLLIEAGLHRLVGEVVVVYMWVYISMSNMIGREGSD